jgi:hypothetical protein
MTPPRAFEICSNPLTGDDMSETETTDAFLKRIAKWIARNVTPDGDLRAAVLMSPTDADLLLSLARRGAAIRNLKEPT